MHILLKHATALLARLPADRSAIDLVTLVLILLGGLALSQGWVTPEQLPSVTELALAALGAVGLRGASLAAKRSQAGAQALASAVSAVRAGKPVPAELVAHAEALVEAVRVPPTSPAQVAIVPRRDV